MKIKFKIEYRTQWGEELRVQVDAREVAMSTADGIVWEGELNLRPRAPYRLSYRYAMYRDGELVWTEWEVRPHVMDVEPGVKTYEVADTWRAIPADLPLYSTAYTDGLELQDEHCPTIVGLELRTTFTRIGRGERLAVMSSLDGWQKPLPMSHLALHEWAVQMPDEDFEYKFVVVDKNGNIVCWEDGGNRLSPAALTLRDIERNLAEIDPQLSVSKHPAQHVVQVVTCPDVRIERPQWRVAGVVIPVFSLRSEGSQGVGDFGDLAAMVRWAASVGMKAVQILPVGDTTMGHSWMDSYPYNTISIYALNPVYADLRQIMPLGKEQELRRAQLNALLQMDFEGVERFKREVMHEAFDRFGAEVLATDGYKEYHEANRDWLVPYAAFSVLRDKYGTAHFADWPEMAKYDARQAAAICADNPLADYYCYVQYVLHCQLLAAKQEASACGVILKGDIPIGISRDSVEAWSEAPLFNLDGQAGAPPDNFSLNGQNWGFPTYNWEVMARDKYAWWEHRFRHMAQYFNAYRIDHVLGFFRIWEIPSHSVHGLLGQFVPALPMNVYEIEQYGLHFDRNTMTRPYISDYMLDRIFGFQAENVRRRFLLRRPDGLWNMRPEYDTQRKVQAAVEDEELRDGLYQLISNVLFVTDRSDSQMYHPRIAAQTDYFYESLPQDQKQAFDNLYENYYYHRHNDFWGKEAMKKLPALTQATRMLVCAEDLGMVPACVPDVMERLRILTLEIQTMPKEFGVEFGNPANNPVRSVATISTHDMPTLRGWWLEDKERASRFWHHALHHGGAAPASDMPGVLAEEVVRRHLECPSMLCLLSLQDWLAIDDRLRLPDAAAERINIPANPRHYWRYRMHLTIEQLGREAAFGARLRQLIAGCGR